MTRHVRPILLHFCHWGGISQNKLKPLFITQKKCVKVMFGDNEAYFNKFMTCVKTRPRPRESQQLGQRIL